MSLALSIYYSKLQYNYSIYCIYCVHVQCVCVCVGVCVPALELFGTQDRCLSVVSLIAPGNELLTKCSVTFSL